MATPKEALSEAPVFDTRRYVRNLKRDGGIGEQQADAHAEGLQAALGGLAKASDILALKSDILALRADNKVLRAELKADIKLLRAELKADNKAIMRILDAHQEQMRGLRQTMMIGFSMNGGIVLLLGLLLVLR